VKRLAAFVTIGPVVPLFGPMPPLPAVIVNVVAEIDGGVRLLVTAPVPLGIVGKVPPAVSVTEVALPVSPAILA